VYDKSGRAGGDCPRRGYVELVGDDGTINYAKTTCKTWRCLPCRNKLVSLVRMRLEYGLSTLERCLFITLTLRLETGHSPEDVSFAQAAWRRLLALLKKTYPQWKGMKWFKVVEFTRRDQPHLHLIIQTGIPGEKVSCLPNEKDPRWNRKTTIDSGCSLALVCVHHRVATAWLDVTGSWVVDVQSVKNAARAAKYLCKYLTKSLVRKYDETIVNRRWSKSNNWPKLGQLQYRGSLEFRWKRVRIIQGFDETLEEMAQESEDRGDPLMERLGDEYVRMYQKRRMRKAQEIKISKMLGV